MDNAAAEPILEQTPQPSLTIGMLLCPDFNGMAAHAFIDPFRAANYVHGGVLYQWQFLSLRGDTVIASNGMVVKVAHTFSRATLNFDILVINASWAPERFQNIKLQS